MSGLSSSEKRALVTSNTSCEGKEEVRWWNGEKLFKLLQNVDIKPEEGTGKAIFILIQCTLGFATMG